MSNFEVIGSGHGAKINKWRAVSGNCTHMVSPPLAYYAAINKGDCQWALDSLGAVG